MKKQIISLILCGLIALNAAALTACGDNEGEDETTVEETTASEVSDETTGEEVSEETTAEETSEETTAEESEDAKSEGVMTYAEYAAAAVDSEVVVETYVQAKQSWWDNKATFYTQDQDGAYFIYEMPCTEEEYAKLTTGTKIKVTGYKSEWSGEIEITDAKFEILEGSYTAEPTDVTEFVGKDEISDYQNRLVSFKGMTIESVSFKNDAPGDDIYVSVSKDGTTYDFCVEFYLTGTETEVYSTVSELNVGDVVDIEGFLYWYNGVNTHITAVTK